MTRGAERRSGRQRQVAAHTATAAPLALPPRAGEPRGGGGGCAAGGISGTPRPRLPPSHPGRDEKGRWTRAGGTGTMTFAGFVVALVLGTLPGARGPGQVSAGLPAARAPPHPPGPPPPQPPAGCPAGSFAAPQSPWPAAAPALPRRGSAGRVPRSRRGSCAPPGDGGRPRCGPGSGRRRAEGGRVDCERGERGCGARTGRGGRCARGSASRSAAVASASRARLPHRGLWRDCGSREGTNAFRLSPR